MGLFSKLKDRLTRTRKALSDGITGLFQGGRPLDDQLLSELEELLYSADLGTVSAEVVAELGRLHKRGEIKGEEDVRTKLRELLLERLDAGQKEIEFTAHPTVILIAGVNGSGKTTSIAKLAYRYQQTGKKVVLAACDTFRAAAADQLEIWANRAKVQIVRKQAGADPAAVAFDAVTAALSQDADVLIIDTAGRLHTQKNLMQELTKIQRIISKQIPEAPHHVWLVLDSTNGQNAIMQAQEFTAAVDITGLILAKLDGTARGGALFTIQRALGLPVRYIGTGESMELLEEFDAEAFVDAVIRE
ncbi:MAG: fused signal recognition particle receptor [Planctomycetota bacterium]